MLAFALAPLSAAPLQKLQPARLDATWKAAFQPVGLDAEMCAPSAGTAWVIQVAHKVGTEWSRKVMRSLAGYGPYSRGPRGGAAQYCDTDLLPPDEHDGWDNFKECLAEAAVATTGTMVICNSGNSQMKCPDFVKAAFGTKMRFVQLVRDPTDYVLSEYLYDRGPRPDTEWGPYGKLTDVRPSALTGGSDFWVRLGADVDLSAWPAGMQYREALRNMTTEQGVRLVAQGLLRNGFGRTVDWKATLDATIEDEASTLTSTHLLPGFNLLGRIKEDYNATLSDMFSFMLGGTAGGANALQLKDCLAVSQVGNVPPDQNPHATSTSDTADTRDELLAMLQANAELTAQLSDAKTMLGLGE